MRRHLVAACAASLLTLAACAAEATAPAAAPVDAPDAAPSASRELAAPAAEAPVDRELETIRISVMGMG